MIVTLVQNLYDKEILKNETDKVTCKTWNNIYKKVLGSLLILSVSFIELYSFVAFNIDS